MVEFWGKQPLVAYILCIKLNFYAAQRASYAKISRNEFYCLSSSFSIACFCNPVNNPRQYASKKQHTRQYAKQ